MIKIPRPEFFDIFGVWIFSAITLLSGWAITTGQPIPKWGLLFLFFVGVIGVIVDGTIVNLMFIKRK